MNAEQLRDAVLDAFSWRIAPGSGWYNPKMQEFRLNRKAAEELSARAEGWRKVGRIWKRVSYPDQKTPQACLTYQLINCGHFTSQESTDMLENPR